MASSPKAPAGQISLTDPDARSMATSGRGTGMVGYNVQTAVDAKHHLIVAHGVTNLGHDRDQLSSMAQKAREATAAAAGDVIPTDEELIASAIKAAPRKVSENATNVTPDPKGGMRTLRKGTNGFTCMPDNPETPGPDPMCWDKNAGEWVDAYLGHKTPPAGKVGLMYMLAGGTDASNTDPYSKKPTASNHWIKTGPHIMIVGADPSFYDQYPKGEVPDTSSPYVMWAGTPYQDLMAPIR